MLRHSAVPLVIGLALSVGSHDLRAQDVGVRSFLDRTEIGLNQQFTLTVEIEGVQRGGWNPEMPDVSEFARFMGNSTSQNIQMVNGRVSASYSIVYQYRATKLGRFTIGPITVDVQGQRYRTDPISFTITDSPTGPTTVPDGRGGSIEIDPEDLFMEASVSSRRVYVGQPVVVDYRIFTRLNIDSYSVNELPTSSGFWVEEFEIDRPRTEEVVREGKRYATALLRRVAAFPTSSGTKTLDPMSIDAQVRTRSNRRDPFGFGGSVFGRAVTVPVSTSPVSVEVLPLPDTGRPGDFSGFVGDLTASASVDRTEVETGDAITYTLRLDGTGNLRTLADPVISFPPDFEVFPPETSERIDRSGRSVGGRKTFNYILIPRSPGTRSIPAVSVSYFNPRTATYETASARGFDITVTGEATGAPVIAGRGRAAIETLREDIRFIRIEDPDLKPASDPLGQSPVFWTVLLAPLAVLGGAAGVRRHRDRLSGDVAYARTRRAGKMAKQRMRKARSLLGTETRKEFYAEVGNALRGFLGDRLNIAEAGFLSDDVRRQLVDRGVNADDIDSYLECLSYCDRQRFAPSDADEGEMNAFLHRASDAMARIAEEL